MRTRWRSAACRKHLHMRGEDAGSVSGAMPPRETPPHAWRRRRHEQSSENACWKHLHMRGEDEGLNFHDSRATETLPHAWRRPNKAIANIVTEGNTSTCVEKTVISPETTSRMPETPPHAWRRLAALVAGGTLEETPPRAWRRLADDAKVKTKAWKHLHMRGEDLDVCPSTLVDEETPPHAWRRRNCQRIAEHGLWKHLHMRGEDLS